MKVTHLVQVMIISNWCSKVLMFEKLYFLRLDRFFNEINSHFQYDINNVAVEEYFEKFAEFAALGKGANIADLPKDPRAV